MTEKGHFKDQGLDELSAAGYNVAQFASYSETAQPRYSRMLNLPPNYAFDDPRDAASRIITQSSSHSINIRSFAPNDPKSRPFDYGITNTDEAAAIIQTRQSQGLHTIINETIPVDDGGVSGVAFGDVMEYVPFDTPRGVEKSGSAQFNREMGAAVIKTIYGFAPSLSSNTDARVEFSVHPIRRGYRDEHTIIWEIEQTDKAPDNAEVNWPNRLSDMVGDKTFGLIVADTIGLPVPQTTAFNRTVAPFTFGMETGSNETWLRTAPNKQTPGLYTTTHGWIDPYELMSREDPTGKNIASILAQKGVRAQYSGACIMGADGSLIIEGKVGEGDDFMVGEKGTASLPHDLIDHIQLTYDEASASLGPVRFEWVFDGERVWIVQLHRGASVSAGQTIVPGELSTRYVD